MVPPIPRIYCSLYCSRRRRHLYLLLRSHHHWWKARPAKHARRCIPSHERRGSERECVLAAHGRYHEHEEGHLGRRAHGGRTSWGSRDMLAVGAQGWPEVGIDGIGRNKFWINADRWLWKAFDRFLHRTLYLQHGVQRSTTRDRSSNMSQNKLKGPWRPMDRGA